MWAQVLERIGVEQGLSQGFVTCLIQDQEGFIWIGTQNGLSRYDGYRFKTFDFDPFNQFSLPSNHVKCLKDRGEYLIIGTESNGICIFHKKTERFFRLPALEKKQDETAARPVMFDNLPSLGINGIVIDSDSAIWVQTHMPSAYLTWLCRLRLPDRFWERLPMEPGLVAQIKYDCWDGQSRLFSLNGEHPKISRLSGGQMLVWHGQGWEALPLPGDLGKRIIIKIPCDHSAADYWLTAENEIWQSSNQDRVWEKMMALPVGKQVVRLDSHFAWVRTNATKMEAYPFRASPFFIDWSKPIHLAETPDVRWDHFIDRSGIYFQVNSVHGFFKINLSQKHFQNYALGKSVSSNILPLPNGNAVFLEEYSKPHFIKPIGPMEQALLQAFWPEPTYGIAMQQDELGNCWMLGNRGTREAVLVRFDPKNRLSKTWKLPFLYYGLTNFRIDPADGSVWFAANDKLYHFVPDGENGNLSSFPYQHLLKGRQIVTALVKTADGSWWVATDNGLLRFWDTAPALPQAKCEVFLNNPSDRNSLSHDHVSCLLSDPTDPHLLWIGTKGGGLNRLDMRTKQFTHINKQNGLADNVVYGVLPEEKGLLWLSTNRGLVRYDPQNHAFKNYLRLDGVQEDEFNTWAYAKGNDGKLFFGGINGMTVFDPSEIKNNPNKPRTFITGLKINNLRVEPTDSTGLLDTSAPFVQQLTLPYSKNNITLEFSALEFTAPAKNRYRYWLEGAEKEGAHEGSETFATYLNLPAGRYTFIVYGSNNDGIWSDQPARLEIQILPPWYHTWWAYALYAGAVLALFFWYQNIKAAKRQLQRELEKKEHLLELQKQEAAHLEAMHRLKLDEFAHRILEKTKLIEELTAPSDDTKEISTAHDLEVAVATTPRLPRTGILTKQDWLDFQKLFDDSYPGFQAELAQNIPSLTAAETRFLLLRKMGLKQHEIAAMLSITPDAVKKTRQRLQRKLTEQGIPFPDFLIGKDEQGD